MDANGARLVTALPTDDLLKAIERFGEANLNPAIITVDHALLDRSDQKNVVLYDGDQIQAALSDGGLTGSAERLSPLIAEIIDTEDVLVAICSAGAEDEGTALILRDADSHAAFLHHAVGDATPPNFRIGALAKRRNWTGILRGWKRAAILMAACLVLWLLDMTFTAVKHDRSADVLYTEAQNVFQRAFPGTPVRSLRRQAAQRIGGVTESSFVELSVALSEALEQSTSVRLAGMRYGDGDTLVADLRFPDAATLEALKTKLQDRGFQVREGGNLRREGNGDYAGQLFLGGS